MQCCPTASEIAESSRLGECAWKRTNRRFLPNTKSRDGREDVAERQPLWGQVCLHRRSSDFTPEFQRAMRPEKIVMASQQLQMIFQPPRSPSRTEGPTMPEGRALTDRSVQTFDVGCISTDANPPRLAIPDSTAKPHRFWLSAVLEPRDRSFASCAS